MEVQEFINIKIQANWSSFDYYLSLSPELFTSFNTIQIIGKCLSAPVVIVSKTTGVST